MTDSNNHEAPTRMQNQDSTTPKLDSAAMSSPTPGQTKPLTAENAQPPGTGSTVLDLLAAPLSEKDCTAIARIESQPLSINPPPSASPPALSPPATRKQRRNGRVARLPKAERDLVNRMLWNGVPYKQIIKAVEEVSCYTLTERNISNWATGGYLEWRIEQEAVLQHRLDQDHLVDFLRRDDANELPEVGLQAAATRLSQILMQKLATAEDPSEHIEKYTKMVDLLCRLNREIAVTQQNRDQARRSLGKEYDPVRVKEDNDIAILEEERDRTSETKSSDPEETVPFLRPLPWSTVEARDNAYDRQKEADARQKQKLEFMRLITGKLPPQQPESAQPKKPIPSPATPTKGEAPKKQ